MRDLLELYLKDQISSKIFKEILVIPQFPQASSEIGTFYFAYNRLFEEIYHDIKKSRRISNRARRFPNLFEEIFREYIRDIRNSSEIFKENIITSKFLIDIFTEYIVISKSPTRFSETYLYFPNLQPY